MSHILDYPNSIGYRKRDNHAKMEIGFAISTCDLRSTGCDILGAAAKRLAQHEGYTKLSCPLALADL
jgi:hypothetical protein